jgi:nicotinate-nucleotide adenylyltransferase
VIFIPNGDPPHKPDDLTDSAHRYEMVRLATQSNPRFEVSRIEIERSGPSYAVHTLTDLRAERPDSELYYIIGVDALAEILTWHRPDEVIQLATFVAVTRPGFPSDSLSRLPESYRSRIELLDTIGFDLSATRIRERVRARLPIRYLLPDSVAQYIEANGLYRQK